MEEAVKFQEEIVPHQLSVSEQLAHSTVRIETTAAEGSGTGFFYRFADKGETHIPAIFTNKHAVNGALRDQFVRTEKDPDGAMCFELI